MLRACKIPQLLFPTYLGGMRMSPSINHVTAIEMHSSIEIMSLVVNLFMRNIARSVGPAAVTLVVQLRVDNEDYNPQWKQMRNEEPAT